MTFLTGTRGWGTEISRKGDWKHSWSMSQNGEHSETKRVEEN